MAEEKKKAGRPKGSKNKTTSNKETEKAFEILGNSKKVPFNQEEIVNILTRPHQCCSCGKRFVKQKGNFSFNGSDLYKGNNNYLPICNSCLEKEFNAYVGELGNEYEAIRRICLHWNMYFNDEIYAMCKKQTSNSSTIKFYISRLNMNQYANKTYDTYLYELEQQDKDDENNNTYTETVDDIETSNIKPQTIDIFGFGYDEDDYLYLQKEYEDWTSRYECKTKSQELIFKNLSINDLVSHKASIAGDADTVAKCQQAQSKLMADGNLKPSQNTEMENLNQECFGVLIQQWEDNEPIPEPQEQWKDVDNIKKYIEVFFLGHLCKMMKIKNKYSQSYDEYMAEYTVTKPEYDEDEVEFDDIFSGGENNNK